MGRAPLHVDNLAGTEFLHTLATTAVGDRTATLVAHVAVRKWGESIWYRIGVEGTGVLKLADDLDTAVDLYNQVLDELAAAEGLPP